MTDQISLVACFFTMSKKFLRRFSHIKHELTISDEGDYTLLIIPMSNSDGFDLHIDVSEEEILIHCGDFHEHHQLHGEVNEFVNHFLGYLYDLLSPLMRLRVFTSGGKPYKWSIEYFTEGLWIVESTTGNLFYNFLARREEMILQNRALKIREDAIEI